MGKRKSHSNSNLAVPPPSSATPKVLPNSVNGNEFPVAQVPNLRVTLDSSLPSTRHNLIRQENLSPILSKYLQPNCVFLPPQNDPG